LTQAPNIFVFYSITQNTSVKPVIRLKLLVVSKKCGC